MKTKMVVKIQNSSSTLFTTTYYKYTPPNMSRSRKPSGLWKHRKRMA